MAVTKVLNVAEKPSVAKEISAILSGGQAQRRQGFSQYNPVYEFPYELQGQRVHMTITSVSGHLMELEFDANYRSWHSCSPVELFTAAVSKKTRADETQRKIEKTLVNEARQSQWLVLWLDCDREGENIAFEVKSVCERAASRRLRVFRARFSALIPRDIVHAAQHLAAPNEQLALACDARSEIDLRIGAAFTRFQTMRLQSRFPALKKDRGGVISYGPCQFPTLGFVVERFLHVQNFEREPFFRLDLAHRQADQPGAPTTAFAWDRGRVFDRVACLCLYEALVAQPAARVEAVEKRPTWKRKPLPLTTVELQKRASRWLRVSSEQTMKAAESLYNKGVLSYPRTETNKFKEGTDVLALVRLHESSPQWGDYVSQTLLGGASKYEPPRHGGADDQAHPPIHPTKSVPLASIADAVERKVYEFVTRHFLACCSKDAVGHQTTVRVRIAGEGFSTSGLMIAERNYLDIYKYENWSASAIPVYEQGDVFVPSALAMAAGETAPPPLLSEADLIALMDSNGIGTDATIAEHIKTILKREYAEKVNDGTQFKPTTLGLALVLSYEHMGLDLAKPALRAAMENDCKAIALGQKDCRQVVQTCMEQMKEIFLSVTRNAQVLDQTFSEHFNQPAVESDGYGGGGDSIRSSAAATDSSAQRRRSTNDEPPYRSAGAVVGSGAGGVSHQPSPDRRRFSDPPQPRTGARPSYPPPHGQARASSAASVPRCQDHGLECVEREVAREGPNRGRHFFACPLPQGQQCDHFAWADAVAPGGGDAPVLRCSGHDEPCNERVVKKDGPNKGRTFYACRRDPSETCGFFQFKDELPVSAGHPTSRGGGGGTRSSTATDAGAAPLCPGHRLPCVMRVTRKQGPNLNREFFVCSHSESESCGYFVWKDEAAAAPSSGGSASSNQAPACACGLPGVLLTCRNGANKGRTFYKCPQQPQEQQCGFFEWCT
ncbi:hypothetical protein PybrP1_007080 [[Pythium] brassicae (nom. inval.)]|nr:hypothetical protein PybrP1_007080 [[Pythium] brassicae (nom. inval.)]